MGSYWAVKEEGKLSRQWETLLQFTIAKVRIYAKLEALKKKTTWWVLVCNGYMKQPSWEDLTRCPATCLHCLKGLWDGPLWRMLIAASLQSPILGSKQKRMWLRLYTRPSSLVSRESITPKTGTFTRFNMMNLKTWCPKSDSFPILWWSQVCTQLYTSGSFQSPSKPVLSEFLLPISFQ